MQYLQFVMLFLVAPTAVLIVVYGPRGSGQLLRLLGVVVVLALIYALPWDYLRIHGGSWVPNRFASIVEIAGVPIEDAFFFALQVLFVGTLTAIALRRPWWRE